MGGVSLWEFMGQGRKRHGGAGRGAQEDSGAASPAAGLREVTIWGAVGVELI
jgi:hypothetical protein